MTGRSIRVAVSTVILAMILGVTAVASGLTTGPRTAPVRMTLRRHALRAGEAVQIPIVDASSRPIIRTDCFELQRRTGGRWQTINRTHGIRLPCTREDSVPQDAHSHVPEELPLYDDLTPGRYRITLLYKYLPKHWRTASMHGQLRKLRAKISVGKFHQRPEPHIAEHRIKAIGLASAAAAGDAHPKLIQHVEGTHFDADRIASGDLIWDWHWAILIAIRGSFPASDISDTRSAGRATASPPKQFPVLTLVIDARTGRTEDFGLSDHYPKLSQMRPVTTDYRR
jgi:hypothetical protein